LQEVSTTFGSQCVVLSVEAKRVENDWEAFTNNGRDRTGVFVGKWIESAQEFGVGEVFITSIDRDGTKRGLDLDLNKLVRSSTDLPVIGSGGVGSVQDIYQALHEAELDGVCVGAALHSDTVNIDQIRNDLNNFGIKMRKSS
jgi:cyclase